MSRELVFDGYWEGDAVYTCDNCGAHKKFRFDSEDVGSKKHRAHLRKKYGWCVTKIGKEWYDFCSERCRNQYIRTKTS